MTIEQVLNGTRKRTLFDSFSDEFKRSSVEQKLTLLASLNYYNLLDKIIKDYKIYYKERKDILGDLKNTLVYLYSELTSIKNKHLISNKSISSIIKKLKEELKSKIEANYSIDEYVESFLLQNKAEIRRQHFFFKINLTENITENLLERDKKEKKGKEESYVGLYKFLKNNLLPDYHKSNYQGYMIDMGMNYQVEYLVKHYLQKEKLTKNDYVQAIIYIYKILFFKKKPYHKFFLLRVNQSDKDAIQSLYKKNEIAIHFNTKKDLLDYSKLIKDENPKQQYVNRWKT
ncbi:MAG: hypothetical protein ACWA45_01065, partial [Flavobacteriales bacterium]